ncbi:hypothetical protein ES708_31817 [subsurface metagenome]
MAKPKNPLLSLGARGTIADSLTFQKRARGTIARRKPIPTDPRSPAQLAWRQVYRDAVTIWNTLTFEEKEAWRGICPRLTPFQCFMRSELKWPAPPPPPELWEDQLLYNAVMGLYGGNYWIVAQILTIPNRIVTKLGFWLSKYGSPTGDVIFGIARYPSGDTIVQQVLRDASLLNTAHTYEELEWDSPPTIDEDVFLAVYFLGGTYNNYVRFLYQNTDVKPGEYFTRYNTTWRPQTTWDCAYRYAYKLP